MGSRDANKHFISDWKNQNTNNYNWFRVGERYWLSRGISSWELNGEGVEIVLLSLVVYVSAKVQVCAF